MAKGSPSGGVESNYPSPKTSDTKGEASECVEPLRRPLAPINLYLTRRMAEVYLKWSRCAYLAHAV